MKKEITKKVEIEICDICKKKEIREWNNWCVVCNKVMCEDCASENYETEDGSICKECEKKGFEICEDTGEGCEVYFNGKEYKGETYW